MPHKSHITKDSNGEFDIKIFFRGNQDYLSLHAIKINDSDDIISYVNENNGKCAVHSQEYIHLPMKISSVLDAIKKNKLYGVLDFLPCKQGYSITLLSRFNYGCSQISLPMLFFKGCKNEKCINDNSFSTCERNVVIISTSKMTPVDYSEQALNPIIFLSEA